MVTAWHAAISRIASLNPGMPTNEIKPFIVMAAQGLGEDIGVDLEAEMDIESSINGPSYHAIVRIAIAKVALFRCNESLLAKAASWELLSKAASS